MFRFVCEAEAGASTAASSCPASTTAVTSTTGTDKCAAGWVHAEGSCYRRFTDQVAALGLNILLTVSPDLAQVSWSEARVLCQCGQGGHLASVTSAEEAAAVAGLVTANTWLGGRDWPEEGSWAWTDGIR